MSERKARYRHNKKRNTAFLFEALVKEMAKAVLEKNTERQTQVAQLIKQHFKKGTGLYEELRAYRAINETKDVDAQTAHRIIAEARYQHSRLNEKAIFNEQSNLIRKINHNLGAEVYANFVPNYKSLASIAQMFSGAASAKEVILLEDYLVETMVKKDEPSNTEMQPIDNLVYKTFAKKFNEQYAGTLQEEQREVLTRFIFSMSDNGISLKSYLNEEIERLRNAVVASYDIPEIKNDERMLSNAHMVVEFLDSLQKNPLDEKQVKKILKVQQLVREVNNDG